MAEPSLLHLRAEDAEDLAVVSSCLQDSLVPLADMRYERAARRFIVAVNRFRWEGCAPCTEAGSGPKAVFERIACGIVFEGVRKVSVQGIDQQKRDQLLELLAVLTGDAAAARLGGAAASDAGIILLVFAGGGTIRLDVDDIRCRIQDFGEAWPTQWRPWHRIES
ncbi:MAG TPA: DUF2948 family protein [Alphaproteobacteria bacterium]|nr:DUF2948 family protein [Alphaproteobacteria bacterium]